MSAFRLLLAVLLIGSTDAAAREFTSQDGRKINGERLAHPGDQVIIKVGAKEFAVPVASFSPDDQQFINPHFSSPFYCELLWPALASFRTELSLGSMSSYSPSENPARASQEQVLAASRDERV